MLINQEERRTFGRISNLYDKARIGYPAILIDDILDYAEIKTDAIILDIGCGTGQATLPFAQRGYNVIGLDMSQEMIDVAKKKCSSFSNVSFRVETFEDVDFSPDSFDVLTSGMAWHWINQKEREEKAHRILKSGGTLALFWSYQRKQESDFVKALGRILDKYGGADRGPAGSKVRQISEMFYHELKRNPLFTLVEIREYEEDFEFSKNKYFDLVISYGWVQGLPEDKRRALTQDLKELYREHQEPLPVPYKYVLLLAKKS